MNNDRKLDRRKFIGTLGIVGMTAIGACNKSFLNVRPFGELDEGSIANQPGVEKLLIGAYAMLNNGRTGVNGWRGARWLFGSVASDDAHFGTTPTGTPEAMEIERYNCQPTNSFINRRWEILYSGVQRANDVINLLAKVPKGDISESEEKQIKAEAVFLRAVFHLQAAMLWGNVPYIDESISFNNKNYKVSNTVPIWPKLEADFDYASKNLMPTNTDAGRANSWAAKAFLAKVYMFEHKFKEARPLLEDIIKNGITAKGEKYALVQNYHDNFDASKKNNSESVFAIQMTVNGGVNGNNGTVSWGTGYAGPYGGPYPSYGFFQPSFSLVNSYKTDGVTGLPLIYNWNDFDIKNDQGLSSSDPFVPYTGTLDPRLDWTVSRRGIPLLDWGVNPGKSWVRFQDEQGPYLYYKNANPKSQPEARQRLSTSVNYVMIRFAHILLWAAEVEVEIGSLGKAEEYVNIVRKRAANSSGWVHKYVDDNNPSKGFSNIPAANYKINPYPNNYFNSKGKIFARDAVRFEEKIEWAMEGHRFFDLQRHDDGNGYMAGVLNGYLQHEQSVKNLHMDYMKGASFTDKVNKYYPIPQQQIDLSVKDGKPTLIQNKGY